MPHKRDMIFVRFCGDAKIGRARDAGVDLDGIGPPISRTPVTPLARNSGKKSFARAGTTAKCTWISHRPGMRNLPCASTRSSYEPTDG
jgi:hypothetical protein